jgi:ectoine hydroxylase-related dioxygenase (phytanoyl-CoA dioxygenase family)
MIPQGAALIVAEPYSQRNPSEQIKLGRLHRDTARGDPGYLTMLAFMDDVTADNGSVTVWLGSQDIVCDQKHRERALRALSVLRSVTLVGPKGTCWFFDSRLLHPSNPNFTEGTRRTMQCFLGTPGMLPLTITS